MNWNLKYALPLNFLLAAFTVSAVAQDFNGEIFTIDDPQRHRTVKIDWRVGDISLEGWALAELGIRAERDLPPALQHAAADSHLAAVIVDRTVLLHFTDSEIALSQKSSDDMLNLFVRIPAQYDVEINNHEYGDVAVSGLSGAVDIQNTAGDIMLTRISGPVTSYTEYGRTEARIDEFHPETPLFFAALYGDIDLFVPAAAHVSFSVNTPKQYFGSELDLKYIALFPEDTTTSVRSGIVVTGGREKGTAMRIYDIPAHPRGQFAVMQYILNNGGPPQVSLTSEYGNLFLRKLRETVPVRE